MHNRQYHSSARSKLGTRSDTDFPPASKNSIVGYIADNTRNGMIPGM